jgi:hypothetical protein
MNASLTVAEASCVISFANATIMIQYEVTSGRLHFSGRVVHLKRRNVMGEKGSKKDKEKAIKQKQRELEKKQEKQKAKLPAKKPA